MIITSIPGRKRRNGYDVVILGRGAFRLGGTWFICETRIGSLGKLKKPVCAVCVRFVVVTSFLPYAPNTIVKSNNVTGQASD